MKTLFTIFFIMAALPIFAQVQHPAMLSLLGIGGSASDQVNSNVTKTNDGGFIIHLETSSPFGTGNIDSFCPSGGDREIFLKYNGDASVLEWSKCYGYGGDSFLLYLFPSNDGGAVLGGSFNSSSGWGFYVCKQDALGNIIWSHEYSRGSSLSLKDMIATEDGYIMAGGSFYADTNVSTHYGSWTDADMFVLKVDEMGNKVWGKVIGGTGDDELFSVKPGSNGSCYIVGRTVSNDFDCTGNHSTASGAPDVYVARLDKDGNILWHQDLGGTAADVASSAVEDGKGGILIGASTYSSDGDVTHFINPGSNIWVIDLDSNGHKVWDNCYGGGGGNCYPNSICRATDGSIWIGGVSHLKFGEIDTAYGRDDAWFVHTDNAGIFLNAKVLGSHLDDRCTMIYPLSNGNVIAGGFYDTSGGAFSAINTYSSYPASDAFLTIYAPWDQTIIPEFNRESEELKIYPIPAREHIVIEVQKKSDYIIVISDVLSRVMYSTKFIDKIDVQIDGWPSGIYYVSVISQEGLKYMQKMIVE